MIQDNQAADVLLRNVSVNGAGKVFRTNGGHTDIDSHVTVEDSTLKGIKEAVFRTDAPGAHVSLHGVRDDAPHQVEALSPVRQMAHAASAERNIQVENTGTAR